MNRDKLLGILREYDYKYAAGRSGIKRWEELFVRVMLISLYCEMSWIFNTPGSQN